MKQQVIMIKKDYKKDLAKIAGGVAVIGVGAATEVEMKDKKLRIEDALSATKAAVEEGIVAGGGTALVNVIPKVEKLVETLEGGEKLGAKIVLKALEEPARQIAINAGLEPAVIVNKVKKSPEEQDLMQQQKICRYEKSRNCRPNKSNKKCFTKCSINCFNGINNRKYCNRYT